MKLNSIINRYVIAEMIPTFLITLGFFIFVFLMIEMLKMTKLIVNYNVSVLTVLQLLAFAMPFYFIYVVPMSIMMTILLTFLRLSSDNEIIALKTGGVSIYRLLPPVLIFCFMGALFTMVMTIYGMPWGRVSIKEHMIKIISSNVDIGIKERTFNDTIKGVMLYVNKIDLKQRSLIDLFIEDKRNKDIVTTIIAPKGILFSERDGKILRLRLFDGMINQVSIENRSASSIQFNTYDMQLDLENAASAISTRKHRWEMTFEELKRFIVESPEKNAKYYKALMEVHLKFSIPTACFALGLLAMPLGIYSRYGKKSYGLILGLFFFLIYYLLLSVGLVFGENGAIPPFIGMWFSNVIMAGIGLYLLIGAAREKPIPIGFLMAPIHFLRQRLSKRLHQN